MRNNNWPGSQIEAIVLKRLPRAVATMSSSSTPIAINVATRPSQMRPTRVPSQSPIDPPELPACAISSNTAPTPANANATINTRLVGGSDR